jgi:zinc transporter ZupT
MNLFIIIFGVAAFFSTLAGGLVAARYRARVGIISAFAAGVLIAVSLIDLLPESLKLSGVLNVPIEHVMYSLASGFIVLYILTRYFSVHHVCEGDICRNIRHPKGGMFGAVELSAHSFVEKRNY